MEEDQTVHPPGPAPVRLAFRLSYIGSGFFGSQMQASERTVEGEVLAACRRLSLFDDWREAGFLFAGRTDRGVHAIGQVVALTTPYPDRAIAALNNQLPPDCWVTGYAEVSPGFHPRYDARARTYRYFFSKVPEHVPAMDRAAAHFLGTHNFSNFARVEDKNPYRTVHAARVLRDGEILFLEVTAESFLWHQVRCMASALFSIGNGEADDASISRLLLEVARHPLQPAPAEGLVLWNTDCALAWQPLAQGRRSRDFLDHLYRHHTLMGTVCRTLMP